MKSFISAALFAATVSADDQLTQKLLDLKSAFAQLTTNVLDVEDIQTRRSQNLAQVQAQAEAEVIAEVIAIAQLDAEAEAEVDVEAEVELEAEAEVDVECSVEAELEAEVEAEQYDESIDSSCDQNVIINVFNGEVENRRRPWEVEKEVCRPQSGQCHPQCPEAIWDRQLQRIVFSWIEDVDGCEYEPDGTYVTLFTFADNFGQPALNVDENVVLKVDDTALPDDLIERSVTIDNVFFNADYKFRLDVPYYVSAFYYTDERYVRTFGMPTTSNNPLWVPRYAVEECEHE